MTGRDLITTLVINGRASPSFRAALRFAQTEAVQTSSKLQKIGGKIDNFISNVGRAALVGGTVAAGALVTLANKATGVASDLKEVQNVVDTTFGKSTEQINKFALNAKNAFGLSELQAKQFTGSMGAMLKSSGLTNDQFTYMSKNLAGLSGDFASFYNLSQDDAFAKISAGIAGETEPLKRLGINMSVANLQAFALSQGIKTSYQNMDQASQTALRYSYLMSVSKDAQGDFARTQDGLANQQRLFQVNISELSKKIGNKLYPAYLKVTSAANNFIVKITNNPATLKAIENAISNVADSVIKFGSDAIPKIVEFANYISNHWGTIKSTIIGIGVAFAAWKIVSTVGSAYTAITEFTSAISAAKRVYPALIGFKIKDKAETLILQGLYAKDAIVMGAKTAGMWAMTAATGAWSAITAVATAVGSAFGAVMAFLTSPIGLVILAIGAVIAIVYLLYKNWDTVCKFLVSIWNNYVLPAFKGVGKFFSGIFNGIVGIAKGAVNGLIGAANFLIRGINKIKFTAPDWVPSIGGKTFGVDIPLIPTFAKGGFANQASIFGEAGLEAAIPIKRNNPRSISLLNKTAQLLGVGNSSNSGGGPTFVFAPVIHGGNASENQEMLEEEYYKFEDRVKRVFGDEGRLAFDG